MSEITPIPGDALIIQWLNLPDEIRAIDFPRLEVETVTDDGETYEALRCPRCGYLVETGELYAVDNSLRLAEAYEIGDEDFQHKSIVFDSENADAGATIFYQHGYGGHAVSLPESWTEDWT